MAKQLYNGEYDEAQLNRNGRKRTFGHVRRVKIQISLRIRAVWSESSLGAFWKAKYANFHHADNEDSDLTMQTHKLTWVFTERTRQKVRFLALRENLLRKNYLSFM